ncbi:hypothetical protein [Ornithinibacillus xuwenensis]|uniref:F5/8 type C domain-containing protein n=1 Tax=Ornithinibacillus xuwenensis TaxID=3144668 RepID=A0ABU9XBV3_9BACI
MKNYDFNKAQQIIEENKENLKKASLGMQEDWFWTADTVFENGEYVLDLNTVEIIAGISGSRWATPSIRLTYLDDTEEMFTCYQGESESSPDDVSIICASGPLSSEVQKNIPKSKEYRIGR